MASAFIGVTIMPTGFTIEIKGVKELVSRYKKGERFSRQLLDVAMTQGVKHVSKDATIYPPETKANRPPPPYYIRGVGTQYKTYNRGESRQLGERWKWKGENLKTQVKGTVWNAVFTYGPYVHGIMRQIQIHKDRGWRNVEKIATDNLQHVQRYFDLAGKTLTDYLNGK